MTQWEDGASGEEVKKIIDENFDILDIRTKEISLGYVKEFTKDTWSAGTIFIPYTDYLKINPCVEVYIKTNRGYCNVFDGYSIKENGVEIQSDIIYEGKVVIR